MTLLERAALPFVRAWRAFWLAVNEALDRPLPDPDQALKEHIEGSNRIRTSLLGFSAGVFTLIEYVLVMSVLFLALGKTTGVEHALILVVLAAAGLAFFLHTGSMGKVEWSAPKQMRTLRDQLHRRALMVWAGGFVLTWTLMWVAYRLAAVFARVQFSTP